MSSAPDRSTFVTALAWAFIMLAGLCTMIAILQNIIVFTVLSRPGVSQFMQAPALPGTPSVLSFVARHVRFIFVAFLAISALTFVSSIGLLRRWNWARLCFVGLMVFSIVGQIAGLGFQFAISSFIRQHIARAAVHPIPNMHLVFFAIAVVTTLLALGFSVLFGWFVKCLLSPAIATEFGQ